MMTYHYDDEDHDDNSFSSSLCFYVILVSFTKMKSIFLETGGNRLGEVVCNPKQECATNTLEKSGLIMILIMIFYLFFYG